MPHLFVLVLTLCLSKAALSQITASVCPTTNQEFPPITAATPDSQTTNSVICPGGGVATTITGAPATFVLPPIFIDPTSGNELRTILFSIPDADIDADSVIFAGFFTQAQTLAVIASGLPNYTPQGQIDTDPAIQQASTSAFRLYNPLGTNVYDTADAMVAVQQLIPNGYGFQPIVGRVSATTSQANLRQYNVDASGIAASALGVSIRCLANGGLFEPITKFFTIGLEDVASTNDEIIANVQITCVPNLAFVTFTSCPTSSAATGAAIETEIYEICADEGISCDLDSFNQAAGTAACPAGLQTFVVSTLSAAAAQQLVTAIRNGDAALIQSTATVAGAFTDGTTPLVFTNVNPTSATPASQPVTTTIRFCGSCTGQQSVASLATIIGGICGTFASQNLGTCGITSSTCVVTENCQATINQTSTIFGDSDTGLQTIVVQSSNVATANALANTIRGGFVAGVPTNALITSIGAGGVILPIGAIVPNPVFGPFNPATNPSQPLILAVTECLAECGPSNCPDTITSSQEDVAVACACSSCGSSPLSPLTPGLLDDFDKAKQAKSASSRGLKGEQSTRVVANAAGVIVAISAGAVPCIGSLVCCEIALQDAANAGVPFGDGAVCFCPGIGIIECPEDSSSSKKGLLGLLGLLGLIPLLLCCCLLLLCCMRRKRAAPDVPFAVFDPHQGTMLPQPIGGPVCGPSVIPSAFMGQSPAGPGGILM